MQIMITLTWAWPSWDGGELIPMIDKHSHWCKGIRYENPWGVDFYVLNDKPFN